MKRKLKNPGLAAGLAVWVAGLGAFIGGAIYYYAVFSPYQVSKALIAKSIGPQVLSNQFPPEVEVTLPNTPLRVLPRYSLDAVSQRKMEKTLQLYRPDYAAFVALEADTGRVIALVSYARKNPGENLALKATFPAASIFKIVTTAAALDQGVLSSDTVIPFDGSYHTLYRRNVTNHRFNRWTHQITLRDAFAKSVNTVFGKIGMYVLEPLQLREYAERFQFDKPIHADVPVEEGTIGDVEEPWGLAELASGYNRVSSMSPLQGALMAAAVVNDGVLMEPFVVEALVRPDGDVVYEANPTPLSVTMKPQTASELRALMRQTVVSGTSRRTFRGLFRQSFFRAMEIGGKTGSLVGRSPRGKCDWFVGFARTGNTRLAVAALTVNEDKWQVKSSYLARVFIENYFRK